MYKFNQGGRFRPVYKKSGLYLISIVVLFVSIGLFTTVAPTYRLSSEAITRWTSDVDSNTFLYLLGMENKMYEQAFPDDIKKPKLSETLLHLSTNIKPNDLGSLLGQELPGFSSFGNKIVVAGEGTSYSSLSFESSPPLEDVLEDRKAEVEEKPEEKDVPKKEEKDSKQTTGDKKVVFVYTTHNRESFLPHLPDSTSPNEAYHKEVNITKVSSHFEKNLNQNGIGTEIDYTDFMTILNQKNWGYGKSYDASRDIVEAAVTKNKDINYIFDIHRDSLPRKMTTKDINGKSYAQILFVIGADHPNYEENLKLATTLHYKIQEKYKGLSRGVIQKAGAGTNGIFNQDVSGNAILVELGGYENKLEELYRSADVLSEVFSEYFWDAEKVSTKK